MLQFLESQAQTSAPVNPWELPTAKPPAPTERFGQFRHVLALFNPLTVQEQIPIIDQ